ncbi:hypothetical protein COR50_11700 [Chitinophaga caeni]|uniref:histidine kinase n=2 Tax=Chitinophaga caeni TaxID=2029983 RepID=A0A291QV12_9BACT|nr:hypothetical protein COR50_11700 [Chitinophaga caeni]
MLFSWLCMCCFIYVKGQRRNYNFYNYSTDNGLLTNDYQKIFYDSKGYVWLASFDGLFRWDGYSVKKYAQREGDSLSLDNNIVYAIYEDSQHHLWVGTIDGLNLYDPSLDVFKRIPLTPDHPKIPVNDILEDSLHQLWLGTSNGLCLFDTDSYQTEWFHSPENESILFCLTEGADNTLWAGTFNHGVLQFNTKRRTFKSFKNSPGKNTSLSSNKIQCILIDRQNRIWIGTEDRGLTVMDRDGKKLASYDNISGVQPFTHSNVRSLYEDKEGNIWIGIGREVLCMVKPGTLQPEPLKIRAQNNGREEVAYVTSITEDDFGNTWFATAGNGLFTTNHNKNVFQNWLTRQTAVKGLNSTVTTSFYEDASHNIWIGTAGSGILHFNPGATLPGFQLQPQLASLAVNDVKGDPDGHIWIATWADGLKELDPKTGKLTSYMYDNANQNSLVNNDVKALLVDDSLIWIGTHGEGLTIYNRLSRQFTHYKNNHKYPFNLQEPAWVNHLYKDRKGRVWISTYSGLFLYDGAQLQHYSHSEDSTSINSNSVNMVTEDNSGRIWVITEQGLDCFNEELQKFEHFNQRLALPTSMKSIICDAQGNLWLGTNDGLISIHPNNYKTVRFDKDDGLYEKTYFQKAVLKSANGTLYFGGPKGFSSFNPLALKSVEMPSRFYFTELSILGETQSPGSPNSILKRSLNTTDTITLTQKQSFFSIGFTAINQYAPQKIKYSYRLNGYEDWIDDVDERKISFSHLQPGIYKLQVRYSDIYGEWQPTIHSLYIQILPYWWQTWWWKFMMAILAIIITVAIFYWRVNSVKKRNRLLKQEVKKQTAQLQAAHNSLVEQHDKVRLQKEELESSYDEIVRQTDKILLQQQQISNQNIELEQAVSLLEKSNASKDYFFSILAHDLKNPVAALRELSSFMKSQLGKVDMQTLRDYVENMYSASSKVFDLLVNLLSWSMSQSRQIQFVPVACNLDQLIHESVELLLQQAQEKNIQFKLKLEDQLWITADYQMMAVVIRNLLSNSIKFSQHNSTVTITSQQRDQGKVLLIIEDEGVGMHQKQLDSLFDINKSDLQSGTAGEKGTGLGLVIVHDFLEANHASIKVSSQVGKGSVFEILLPVAHEIPGQATNETGEINNMLSSNSWQQLPAEKFVKLKGKKILIVEDSKEMRDYLRWLLADIFEIFEATDGAEAYQMAIHEMPSIIITDLLMPNTDGLTFCKQLKAQKATSHIPVIILTSQSDATIQANSYEAGAEAFLVKPVQQEILTQLLLNILQKQDSLYKGIREQIFQDQEHSLAGKELLSEVDQQFLDELIRYIESQVSNPELDAKQVCKAMFISRTLLYNKVKSLTGQTVHEFIKAIRLRKSVQLLLDGNMSISQIALEVGFNSHSYFDKCFIKQFGMGPKEFVNSKKTIK